MEKYSHFNLEYFGSKLTYYRTKIGKTQSELAKALGVSTTTINYYEKAKRDPRCSTYSELAFHLGIDPIQFFVDENIVDLLSANDNSLMRQNNTNKELISLITVALYQLDEPELTALKTIIDAMIK